MTIALGTARVVVGVTVNVVVIMPHVVPMVQMSQFVVVEGVPPAARVVCILGVALLAGQANI